MGKLLTVLFLFSAFIQDINSQNLLEHFNRLRDQQNSEVLDAPSQLITNFRVIDGQPNRVYFDLSRPATGLFSTGIVISGTHNITGITLTVGDSYFTVTEGFNWTDNNTIRYDGGSDIQDTNGNALASFSLTDIRNDITQPTTTGTTYYVDVATGNDLDTGLTESLAFQTIEKATNVVVAGDKVWIKAGNYGAENVTITVSGTELNPIVFEGYKTTPGDITSKYYVYTSSVTFDSTEMPLLDGVNRILSNHKGIDFGVSTSYNIIKNIQIQNYEVGVDGGTDVHHNQFERVMTMNNGGIGNDNGYGFQFSYFSNDADYNRWTNCTGINASQMIFNVSGNYNAYVNSEAYCNEVDLSNTVGQTTDYYFYIKGSYNKAINNHVEKDINPGHNGHGITFKYAGTYSLAYNNMVVNILESLDARHDASQFHVFKDNEVHANTGNRNLGSGEYTAGIYLTSGANNITYEGNYIHDVDVAIYVVETNEDGVFTNSATDLLIKNNIFKDIRKAGFRLRKTSSTGANGTFNNNKFYNNTWHSIDDGLFKIYADNGGWTFSGVEFKNNIFYDIPNDIVSSYEAIPLATWDYNNFSGTTFTGKGSNINSSNPLFVSSTNLKLQETSTLINAGVTLTDVLTDKDGVSRPQGLAYDFGAYEYPETSIPSPSPQNYPVYEESSTLVSAGSVSSINVNYPSTTNINDILVLAIQTAGNQTFTVPSGWDSIASESHNNLSYNIMWKRSDGTEAGTLTVNSSASTSLVTAGLMYRISGCRQTGLPYEVVEVIAIEPSAGALFSHTTNSNGDSRLSFVISAVEDNITDVDNNVGYIKQNQQSTSTGTDAKFTLDTQEILSNTTSDGNSQHIATISDYNSKIGFYLIPKN